MVDFELTAEQEALRDMARKFARQEMLPVAAELDRTGAFPWEVARKAFEAGLMNIIVPEEYGGGGVGHLEESLICEELAAGCAGITSSLMGNNLAVTPILVAGSEELKKKYLTEICRELRFIAFALTEPEAGSDVGALNTLARPDGDSYILNGSKVFITNGGVADFYTVFATTDKSKGYKGLVAIVVPRNLPGVSVGKKEDKLGHRASDTAEVIFEDVPVPKENLIGGEGQGFKIAMQTLDNSRPMIAACSLGIARAALEYAAEYATKRVQFGRPIGENQGVAFVIADMAKDVEAARLLTWYSAWLADRGVQNPLVSAAAKCLASDVAMRVTTDAVQVFGGYGYSREYPVEKLMRDAKLMQIYEGTNEIQRIVIAREAMKARRI